MAVISLAGSWGPEGLEYPDGRHAANVDVTVNTPLGQPATLFVDKYRSALAPNPVRTDSLGNLMIFAEPGSYLLLIHNASIPIEVVESAGERSALEDAAANADAGIPLVFWKDPAGLYSFRPQPQGVPIWGDTVRWREAPPAEDDVAPEGSIHVDGSTGTYYRYQEV
jgi:hypothetical protein